MSIDALFPARAVVEPFFGEAIYPVPGNPTWAHGRPIEREGLELAELPMRLMALAGWRATHVRYTYAYADTGNPAGNLKWVTIDLLTRAVTLADYDDGDIANAGTAGLSITFEALTDGGEASYGFSDAPALDPAGYFWADAEYFRWEVLEQSTGTLVLFWKTRHDPARSLPSWGSGPTESQAWSDFWEARRAELATNVLEYCGELQIALSAAVQTAVDGASGDLDPYALPGLVWLFNPATWAADANHRFRDDQFVNTVVTNARDIWDIYTSHNAIGGLVSMEASGELVSLEAILRQEVVEARNWIYVADRGEAYRFSAETPADDLTPESPFYGLCLHASYFDLICAMVQTGRIFPPRLGNLGLTGNFIEESDEDLGENGPLMAYFGRMPIDPNRDDSGEQYVALYVFGEFAARLLQTEHPRDATYTPDLMLNAAWEYKGAQPDGTHVVAMTLGRGVRLQEMSSSMTIKYDVFRANSRHDFRRPLPRPAHLDPVETPAEDQAALYALPDAGDDFSLDSPFMSDHLSATAAQALDHTMLRGTRQFECHVPDALSNHPTDPAAKLINFSTSSPPTLAVRHLECGGVRFEWYRDGLMGPDPQVTIAIIVRPNTPADVDSADFNAAAKDASFGFAWSLDYTYMTRRPMSEDMLADFVVGSVEAQIGDALEPHGIGFFRLWYSGDDVRIDIERYSDSDESFRPEIVKVEHVMDLPEQGYRLPSRAVRMGDYQKIGSPATDVQYSGVFAGIYNYDRMLDPDAGEIPVWRADNMPPWLQRAGGGYHADALGHIGVLESYVELAMTYWVAGVTTYSDVERVIVSPSDWDEWVSYFGSQNWTEADNRVPGELRTTATTEWMIFTILVDVVVGFIPYVGTSADVAEFLAALETGEDKWGEPVATWQLVLMGIAAAVPFVSGSALKGATELAPPKVVSNSFLGGLLPEQMRRWAMAGMAEEDLLKLLRLWVPNGKNATDAEAMDAATTIVRNALDATPSGSKLDHAEIIRKLADMSVEVLQKAGTTAGGIAARGLVDADASFILTLHNGAVVQVRVPVLAEAFEAAQKANPSLTWRAFLTSRKHTTGPIRAIADTFGLIPYNRARVSTGVPKGGGAWTLMGDLAVDASRRLAPGDMLDTLRTPGIVDTIKAQLGVTPELAARNEAAIGYLTKYADQIDGLLKDLDATGQLDKLVGSKEFDHDYMVVGLARVIEYFDDALKEAGSAERVADLFPAGGRIGDASLPADVAARHRVLLDAVADFSHKAVRQVKFPHAYELELDMGAIIAGKVRTGAIEVLLQATYGARKGADCVICTADGFIVIEAKALARAVAQFGAEGVQPNMLQAMTSVWRMIENAGRAGSTGPLDAALVPAFSPNKFGRKFIFMVDRKHLVRNGQTEAQALFEYCGREIFLASDMIPPAHLEKLRALGTAYPEGIYFDDLGNWFRATQLLEMNALDEVFETAMAMQADDIVEALLAMQTKTDLQALLNAAGTKGKRLSANLAAMINSRKTWAGLTHDKKMAANFFLRPDGAEEFFRILGVNDGWMDALKIDPGDANEALDFGVTLVTREGLEALPDAAFAPLARKAVTP